VKLSSSTLHKAAAIQEQIEKLQGELDSLLEAGEQPATESAPVLKAPQSNGSRPKRTSAVTVPAVRSRGRKTTSPTGPLAPAVVKVLKAKNSPLSVSEILEGLTSNGYKFASAEPKKNLFARIYRLKGVKQVGPGKFAAE
jgi:hypothetical protein